MIHPQSSATIGIAGGTASGKSTIANAIVKSVGAENITHLLHDSYYKDVEQLPKGTDINFDHPESLDTALMIDHLQQLKAGQGVDVPIYDFVSFKRKPQTERAEPRPIIIVEGILVLTERQLRDECDIKIFVDTPADVRFIRRLKRDIAERGRTMESVIEQYMETVRPMHQAFVEPSKVYADVIIPHGGSNVVAVDMMADWMRGILSHIGYSNLDAT